MKGWLIYDSEGAQRNEWFIKKVTEHSRKRGLELSLKIINGKDFSSLAGEVDIALVRAINPTLRKHLRDRGILTLNNFKTASVANDKWLTYLLAKKLGIDAMPTQKISAKAKKIPSLALPFVLKSLDGHGGSEVFLIKNEEDFNLSLARLGGKDAIAQPVCSNPGVDTRGYVANGKPKSAILRRSENGFKSNFSLGGVVCSTDVLAEHTEAIRRLHGYLGLGFVGVDFIFHNGRWVLNEIEDAVGARMLYKCTDIDAAEIYSELAVNLALENS